MAHTQITVVPVIGGDLQWSNNPLASIVIISLVSELITPILRA